MMRESGGVHFTVDELARRADVSRRTVFNHFASVDDIVATVCSEVLGAVVDTFVDLSGAADGDATPMFDQLAGTLRATDLVTPMSYLTRVLGGEAQSPVQAMFLVRAFTEVSERLAAAMAGRHPDAELLDIQLLVGSVMSGVVVLHRQWLAVTAGVDDEHSQAVWASLLERLLTTFRTGFGSDASSSPAL
jgi:AcrR family transcriptional regulator